MVSEAFSSIAEPGSANSFQPTPVVASAFRPTLKAGKAPVLMAASVVATEAML